MSDPRMPKDEGRLLVTRPIEAPRVVPVQAYAPPNLQTIAAELVDRRKTRPIEAHRFGLGARRAAFASTHRGVEVITGGRRSGKTYSVLGPKTVAIAEGRHHLMCCPGPNPLTGDPGCPQFGIGSCGIHCCPTIERGSADFRPMGCVAGQARYCPIHPPLIFEAPRFIVLGCLDLARFWGPIYSDTLRKLLTRLPNGQPAWIEDKQNNRIIAKDESYIIQALPYDRLDRLESWNPAFFPCDEFFDYEWLEPARQRVWDKNTQLLIAATATRLMRGEQQWVIHQIKQKRAMPDAGIQLLSISTLDNEFLDPAARQRIAREAEVLRVHNEQAYRVTVLGELEGRQDACAFSKRTIDNQAPFIRAGRQAWIVVSPPADDGRRDAYYGGPTRFPAACNLTAHLRSELLTERVESRHAGSACYDCPARCAAYEAPPRLERFSQFPYISNKRPTEPGVECYPITLWADPNPEHHYSAGLDFAKGVIGGDYNCVCVFDVTSGEQVASFREQCSQTIMPAIFAAIWGHFESERGGNWGQGGIVPESNNMGYAIIMDAIHVYRVPATAVFHRNDRRRRHILSGGELTEPGFATTRGSKYGANATLETPYGKVQPPLSALEDMLKVKDLIIHDQVLYGEMQTFVRTEGVLGGMDGTHDDTVIAAMLGAFGAQIVGRTLRPVLAATGPDPNDPRFQAEDDTPGQNSTGPDVVDWGDEAAGRGNANESAWDRYRVEW